MSEQISGAVETYLNDVKAQFNADGQVHFAWAQSKMSAGYELTLSKVDKVVIQSITELELMNVKDWKQLAAQKIMNMIDSLQYEDSSGWATGVPVDHEPSVVKPGKPLKKLKVEPPQVDSLDDLYAGADWEGIISQDVKAKSKSKKPTAAELELKYKHQVKADWGLKLDEINKILVKKYEDMISKEDILWPYFKAK